MRDVFDSIGVDGDDRASVPRRPTLRASAPELDEEPFDVLVVGRIRTPANRADRMPGAPPNASTSRPESSPMTQSVAATRGWPHSALARAFSSNVAPVSSPIPEHVSQEEP